MLEPLFPEAANSQSTTKPYVGTARRTFPKKTSEAPVPLPSPESERPDVEAIYAALPRNDDGQILWMKALADKTIAPRPGIAADAKDEEPTDMDVELEPKDQPEYKVVFSHKVHTSWMVCDNCHTGLFEMEKGKTVITMDKINAGEACGVCHGKVAAPEPTSCPACHEAMGK
ncbi:MAG TPA: c(7)-type cytochrome triheme domain-containing protein [Casimicrobiaceae bacterium]|nr:c(7)-type cytochrome triheme domain-containing protein [Casimicrobiaceae bacterium]